MYKNNCAIKHDNRDFIFSLLLLEIEQHQKGDFLEKLKMPMKVASKQVEFD